MHGLNYFAWKWRANFFFLSNFEFARENRPAAARNGVSCAGAYPPRPRRRAPLQSISWPRRRWPRWLTAAPAADVTGGLGHEERQFRTPARPAARVAQAEAAGAGATAQRPGGAEDAQDLPPAILAVRHLAAGGGCHGGRRRAAFPRPALRRPGNFHPRRRLQPRTRHLPHHQVLPVWSDWRRKLGCRERRLRLFNKKQTTYKNTNGTHKFVIFENTVAKKAVTDNHSTNNTSKDSCWPRIAPILL